MASSSNTPQKRVDWEIAKACLAELHRKAPSILQQGVLIGGIACWFYRNLLTRANDSVFPVPQFTAAEENFWLSKDIDFTNFFSEDARQLLNENVVVDGDGRRSLQISGVPIGFAQVGLTFDPESAWAESWIANFNSAGVDIQIRVLHPVSLYREKLALVERRGSASDRSHLSVLIEFLRYTVSERAKILSASRSLEERSYALKFLIAVRDRALEVCNDSRVRAELGNRLGDNSLIPLERTVLSELGGAAK